MIVHYWYVDTGIRTDRAKQLDAEIISFPGSTLYNKNDAPCVEELCMLPVQDSAECNLRSVTVMQALVFLSAYRMQLL